MLKVLRKKSMRGYFLEKYLEESFIIQKKAYVFLFFTIVGGFVFLGFEILNFFLPPSEIPWLGHTLYLSVFAVCSFGPILIRKGHYSATVTATVLAFAGMVLVGFFVKYKVYIETGSNSYHFFMYAPIIISLLFGGRKLLILVTSIFLASVIGLHVVIAPYVTNEAAALNMLNQTVNNSIVLIILLIFSILLQNITNQALSATEKELAINMDLNRTLEDKVEKRTTQLKKARDALWGEMQLAKKIQTVLVPEKPIMDGYDISVCMLPADEVGGDYYDILRIKNIDWVVIGDVSGHGVSAGLVMMMAQTAIHTALESNPGLKPSRLLSIINRVLTKNIKQLGENKYMTLTVMASHEKGKFDFSGLHLDILVHRAKENKTEKIETEGMWIGIIDDIKKMLHDKSLTLNKNDTMLVYTDGITEARNKKNLKQMFGEKYLMELFAAAHKQSSEKIRDSILKALENYKCVDDITMVVLKRLK